MAIAKFTIEMAADLGQLKKDVVSMQAVMNGMGKQVAAGYVPVVQATRDLGRAHTQAANQAVLGAMAQRKSAGLAMHQNIQLANQIQDFGIQVAGGQSPLLALAQQGSQLFAVYGGLRPALAAVTGLITAKTVAVAGLTAGVGALAIGYVQGSNQSAEFRRSLALTGGAAGVTAGAFESMIDRIGDATGKGTGYVRDMAQALVSTGRFGPAQIEQVTQGAVLMASITGKTAQEVAQEWVRMSESPGTYAREANKSLNFLTDRELQYIQQLEKNGQRAQAAQLLTKQMMGVYTKNVAEDLGYLQRLAAGTGAAFSSMWDGLLGIGREATLDQQIAKLEEIESLRNRRLVPGLVPQLFESETSIQLANLREIRRLQQRGTDNAADRAREERAKTEQREREEREKAEREAAARAAASAAAALAASQRTFESAKGELRTKEQTLSIDTQLALLQQRRAFGIDNTAEERALTARAIAGLELRKIDAEGVRLASELAAVRQRANTTTTEGLQAQTQVVQLQSRQLELDAQRGQVVRQLATDINGINVAEQQSAQRFAEKVASMREVTAGYQQQLELQGMTQLAAERLTEVRKIEAGYQRELLELSRDLTLSEEDRAARGRSLATEREAQLNAYAQLHAARYREIYDAETGVNSAIREYLDNVAQAGKQAKDATANVMKEMEDQVVKFAKNGKVQVRDLADTVIDEFLRIKVAQPLVKASTGALEGFFGSLFGVASAPAPTPAPGTAPSTYQLSAGGGLGLKLPSYAGGGSTGNGARTGGVDGKGGFFAVLHPQEEVFDYASGVKRNNLANLVANNSGGAAPRVNVNVINQGGAGLQVTSQRTTQGADGQLSVDVMVRQVQDALADNVAAGSGSLYHAMGSRFAKQGVM